MIVLHFVPEQISDEAAAHLLEYLYGLAGAFENQYFAQICRYHDERRESERACHDGQLDLFVDDDVTFWITRRTHHGARSTTGAGVKLTVTTRTVNIATPAGAVNACARPTLAPLSDDDEAMWEIEPQPIRNKLRNPLRIYVRNNTQGERALPPIPPRQKGQRGKVAKSDAHNLWERLKKHESAVLRFAKHPDVAFTNNRAERDLRMSKVKQKVSGCFRTRKYAEAYCRISSYLQSMANQGYNPLVAIQIALAGRAVDNLPE